MDNEGDFASQAIHIAGETEEVEYYSTAEKDASKYFIITLESIHDVADDIQVLRWGS